MPKWKFKRESNFNKQYKLIGRQRQSRVEEALIDLENARIIPPVKAATKQIFESGLITLVVTE